MVRSQQRDDPAPFVELKSVRAFREKHTQQLDRPHGLFGRQVARRVPEDAFGIGEEAGPNAVEHKIEEQPAAGQAGTGTTRFSQDPYSGSAACGSRRRATRSGKTLTTDINSLTARSCSLASALASQLSTTASSSARRNHAGVPTTPMR